MRRRSPTATPARHGRISTRRRARDTRCRRSGQALYGAVYGSPFGNDLLEAFAEAALQGEKLGQRGVTDILTVSFSSNDAVGHSYGPDSPEVHDIAVRDGSRPRRSCWPVSMPSSASITPSSC